MKEEFKQHSLRNPIVEQVIAETLRVVKDIWKSYPGTRYWFRVALVTSAGQQPWSNPIMVHVV